MDVLILRNKIRQILDKEVHEKPCSFTSVLICFFISCTKVNIP